MGIQVVVADDRPEFANASRFPGQEFSAVTLLKSLNKLLFMLILMLPLLREGTSMMCLEKPCNSCLLYRDDREPKEGKVDSGSTT